MKLLRLSQTTASRLLLVLIVLLFITGVVFAIIIFRSNPIDDALAANRVINILFIVEEERNHPVTQQKQQVPISSYVLMYYPGTGRAAIFDIPGELGLLITSINLVDRIDRVYDPSRINNYEREIEKLLGIEINFNVVLSKEKLVSMVDLLEGVEIFIPSAVSYRDDEMFVLFPSGMTVLDGDKSSVYATYSIPGEDRDMEIYRRQRFFMGLLNRMITMNSRLKERDTAKLYYSFFKTDMSQRTLMRLFDELTYIDTDRTNIQAVGGNAREVSGQRLIIPHWDGTLVKEIVRQTMGMLTRQVEDPFSDRSPTVEVLNGTAITGFARQTAEMLRSFGYDVISVENAERNNYDKTVINYRSIGMNSVDENMVRTFAEVIRCTNIQIEEYSQSDMGEEINFDNLELKADITLIIGRDFNGRYVTGN